MQCECMNWARESGTMLTSHHPKCEHYKPPKTVKIWTVTPGKGLAPCTEKYLNAVLSWIEEAEPGEVIQIVVGEMDEAEYDKMPEYMGP